MADVLYSSNFYLGSLSQPGEFPRQQLNLNPHGLDESILKTEHDLVKMFSRKGTLQYRANLDGVTILTTDTPIGPHIGVNSSYQIEALTVGHTNTPFVVDFSTRTSRITLLETEVYPWSLKPKGAECFEVVSGEITSEIPTSFDDLARLCTKLAMTEALSDLNTRVLLGKVSCIRTIQDGLFDQQITSGEPSYSLATDIGFAFTSGIGNAYPPDIEEHIRNLSASLDKTDALESYILIDDIFGEAMQLFMDILVNDTHLSHNGIGYISNTLIGLARDTVINTLQQYGLIGSFIDTERKPTIINATEDRLDFLRGGGQSPLQAA